jgi:hypothetical protein
VALDAWRKLRWTPNWRHVLSELLTQETRR